MVSVGKLATSQKSWHKWTLIGSPSVRKVASISWAVTTEEPRQIPKRTQECRRARGILVVSETSARFPYGYSTYRELPRYGILIFKEYLNSFPHSACFLFPLHVVEERGRKKEEQSFLHNPLSVVLAFSLRSRFWSLLLLKRRSQ